MHNQCLLINKNATYCTCDGYYEPVVEDFELTYDVEHRCKENGFEVVSCEGDNGSDGGYEPKFRRGWQMCRKNGFLVGKFLKNEGQLVILQKMQ